MRTPLLLGICLTTLAAQGLDQGWSSVLLPVDVRVKFGSAPAVARIFAEFLAGHGIYAIAEGPQWNPLTVRASPRAQYPPVGHRLVQGRGTRDPDQPPVHGLPGVERQRTDEVRLDAENVALGHTSKMRWNPAGNWVFSEQVAHPQIIGKEDFGLARATLAGRGSKTQHKQHRSVRRYALRGVILCGLCGRRMGGKWNHDRAYCLCRFPAGYALANRVSHPENVYLQEADVPGPADDWLAGLFGPVAIDATLSQLTGQAAQLQDPAALARAEAARADLRV
jgi:hypothetical protein